MKYIILKFVDLLGKKNEKGTELTAIYAHPSRKNHATLKFSNSSYVVLPYSEIRDYLTNPQPIDQKLKTITRDHTQSQEKYSFIEDINDSGCWIIWLISSIILGGLRLVTERESSWIATGFIAVISYIIIDLNLEQLRRIWDLTKTKDRRVTLCQLLALIIVTFKK